MRKEKSYSRRQALGFAGLTVGSISVTGTVLAGGDGDHGHGTTTTTTTTSDGHGHGHEENQTTHHGTTTAHGEGHHETTTGHGGDHHGTTTTQEGGSSHHGDDSGHHNDDSGHHDDGSGHGGGLGPATDRVTVTMKTTGSIIDVLTGTLSLSDYLTTNRNHFHPHVVHVKKGGTVTWKTNSGRHAIAAYHPSNQGKPNRIPKGAKAWNSGAKTDGGTFSHTFSVEGVYDYYCPPHEEMGMIGSVVVGTPDVQNQPGLSKPSRRFPSRVQQKLASLNERTKNALQSGGGR